MIKSLGLDLPWQPFMFHVTHDAGPGKSDECFALTLRRAVTRVPSNRTRIHQPTLPRPNSICIFIQ